MRGPRSFDPDSELVVPSGPQSSAVGVDEDDGRCASYAAFSEATSEEVKELFTFLATWLSPVLTRVESLEMSRDVEPCKCL